MRSHGTQRVARNHARAQLARSLAAGRAAENQLRSCPKQCPTPASMFRATPARRPAKFDEIRLASVYQVWPRLGHIRRPRPDLAESGPISIEVSRNRPQNAHGARFRGSVGQIHTRWHVQRKATFMNWSSMLPRNTPHAVGACLQHIWEMLQSDEIDGLPHQRHRCRAGFFGSMRITVQISPVNLRIQCTNRIIVFLVQPETRSQAK